MLSFAVRELKCGCGIVISASHNAGAYNGVKCYGPDGCQITTGAAAEILAQINDLDIFAEHQYAVQNALCLWSDVPELMEAALRLYQGRAFYDGTGDLEPDFLARMTEKYGLVVL